jgi:hypothetical protein|tara:strand:- start:1099 stop:1383 length:285 start_codon:yes stop_codon:yes gene_type:complete
LKIETKNGNYDVSEITYKQKRELHRLELKALNIETGKLDVDRWMDLLDHIAILAFGSEEEAEKQLGGLEQEKIDLVLSEIQSSYQALPKKMKGD